MRFSNRGSAREERVFIKVPGHEGAYTDRIFRVGGRERGELINSNKSLMRRDEAQKRKANLSA